MAVLARPTPVRYGFVSATSVRSFTTRRAARQSPAARRAIFMSGNDQAGGAPVPLWSYVGIVTTSPVRNVFTADFDLGMHWHLPVTVHIAGIAPKIKSAAAAEIARLLPEGTHFQAICERIDLTEPVRAHIILTDGTDVEQHVRGRTGPALTWEYGADPKARTWRYPTVVDRVIDGDSMAVRPDLGVRSYPTAEVRVAHINAPEHGTAEGDAATVWAERFLPAGTQVDIVSHALDKYRRLLGTIARADGADYGQAILAAGHAVPYEGGPR